MIIVIIDNGARIKKFSSPENANSYAETMMRKQHDVWVINPKTAHRLELI